MTSPKHIPKTKTIQATKRLNYYHKLSKFVDMVVNKYKTTPREAEAIYVKRNKNHTGKEYYPKKKIQVNWQYKRSSCGNVTEHYESRDVYHWASVWRSRMFDCDLYIWRVYSPKEIVQGGYAENIKHAMSEATAVLDGWAR